MSLTAPQGGPVPSRHVRPARPTLPPARRPRPAHRARRQRARPSRRRRFVTCTHLCAATSGPSDRTIGAAGFIAGRARHRAQPATSVLAKRRGRPGSATFANDRHLPRGPRTAPREPPSSRSTRGRRRRRRAAEDLAVTRLRGHLPRRARPTPRAVLYRSPRRPGPSGSYSCKSRGGRTWHYRPRPRAGRLRKREPPHGYMPLRSLPHRPKLRVRVRAHARRYRRSKTHDPTAALLIQAHRGPR
jgi:hypothetical protein